MRSIQQTLKITNAMYLISSAKVKKARKQLQKWSPILTGWPKPSWIFSATPPSCSTATSRGHHKPKEERKTGFVVITGDKGLAGAYNHNVLKLAGELPGPQAGFHAVPHRPDGGATTLRRRTSPLTRSLCTPLKTPTLDRAQDICDTLVDLYERGALDEIYLVFTHSYSAMRMEPEIIKLLPFGQGHAQRPAGASPRPSQ